MFNKVFFTGNFTPKIHHIYKHDFYSSPPTEYALVTSVVIFGCWQPQKPLQSGEHSHVERKRNEKVGEIGGGGNTIERVDTKVLCRLLLLGEC